MNATIVVGFPTLREADTIGRSVSVVDQGLQKHYRAENCLIVNVDNESDDGTREKFLHTKTVCRKHYISTGNSPCGKGKNLLKLFKTALDVGAQYVVTLDSDVVTMTPEWPFKLLEPLMNGGADYTLPVYTRNRFEGSTTNHFAFPLMYGVYGADLRQPIGGEFGVSRRLLEYLAQQNASETTRQYGIDMFMTCHAVAAQFSCHEVFLGRKLHKPSFPKIAPMFAQIATSALQVTQGYRSKLLSGTPKKILVKAGHVGIDPEQRPSDPEAVAALVFRAREAFFRKLDDYALAGGDHCHIVELMKRDEPEISSVTWAKFLAGFVWRAVKEELSFDQISALVDLITPVFLCRAATLWRKAGSMEPAAVESEILHQAELVLSEVTSLRE